MRGIFENNERRLYIIICSGVAMPVAWLIWSEEECLLQRCNRSMEECNFNRKRLPIGIFAAPRRPGAGLDSIKDCINDILIMPK